jgi:[CysO sulfur-carrier protein]-S-L-cysteine hydrolase
MDGEIRVRSDILGEMLREARREPRLECCGLLAGRDGVVTTIFPTRNALQSATLYEIDPQELFRSFRRMREEGLEHLAQYHSHPATENAPSPRDIEQAYYPEQPYFILSPHAAAANPVRAFLISGGTVREIEVVAVSA